MNARIADNAGTPQLKQFLMVNIKTEFPRGIRIGSLAMVASTEATSVHLVRANSNKPQATSFKLQAPRTSSDKRQAPSTKVQAPSHKPQAPGPWTLEKVSSTFDQGTLLR